jgi:hypothetical protein
MAVFLSFHDNMIYLGPMLQPYIMLVVFFFLLVKFVMMFVIVRKKLGQESKKDKITKRSQSIMM